MDEVLTPLASRPKVSLQYVPKTIAADYEESIRCVQARAFKGTAVLARRAVEMICNGLFEKDEEIPDNLWQKIEKLVDLHRITAQLGKVAHKVRVFGNYGAHPGNDGLATVTESEADDAVTFLEALIQQVFILPDPNADKTKLESL